MNQAAYRDAGGPLELGPRIGRGGEGEVFALANDPLRALKIYAEPDPAREGKVKAMIAAGAARSCPDVAFPEAAAFGREGTFAGFLMRRVQDGLPLHELCSPGSRRREFPTADWPFLVRAALNAARAFERVHAAGAVIGDVNASGVLVSRSGGISLIDADSFQWGSAHPCRVGTPEYTPPELQGRNLDGAARTAQHDGFGLAVLIFQLLFLGRHPHAGVPRGRDVTLLQAIAQNLFPYSRLQSGRLAPPPGTLLMSDLPLGLATLFEKAFGGVGRRPGPPQWADELHRLEAGLTACDLNGSHHRPTSSSCCPWCRIEDQTGAVPFDRRAPRARPHGRPAMRAIAPSMISPARRRAALVLARARATAGEKMPLPRSRARAKPSWAALAHRRTRCPPEDHFTDELAHASRALDAAADEWRTKVGAWSADRNASLLADEIAAYDAAALDHHRQAKRLPQAVQAALVERALLNIRPGDGQLRGLGPRGLAKLAEAGIVNAGDVSRAALEGVRGLGERGMLALLIWRDEAAVEAGRSVRVTETDVGAASTALHARWSGADARMSARLAGLADALEQELAALAVRAACPDARLSEAAARHRQALTDVCYLRLGMHGGSGGPPPAPRSAASSAKASSPACPRCGGAMVKRWARAGSTPNSYFLGCSAYPACSGSRPLRRRRTR